MSLMYQLEILKLDHLFNGMRNDENSEIKLDTLLHQLSPANNVFQKGKSASGRQDANEWKLNKLHCVPEFLRNCDHLITVSSLPFFAGTPPLTATKLLTCPCASAGQRRNTMLVLVV